MTVKEFMEFINKRIEIGDLEEDGKLILCDYGKVIEIEDAITNGKDLLLSLRMEK